MNKEQFIKTHCLNCGTQRCEGIDSEWFEGCSKKWDLDGMNPSAEIERLNNKILELASQMVKIREKVIINTSEKPIKVMFEGQQKVLDLIDNVKMGFWEFGDEE